VSGRRAGPGRRAAPASADACVRHVSSASERSRDISLWEHPPKGEITRHAPVQLLGALLDEASEMTGNAWRVFVNNPG